MKNLYLGKVSNLNFYILDSEENYKDSAVNIRSKDLFKLDKPVPEGTYDPHMGTTDYSWDCATCGLRKMKCPGHFGSIDLKYPIKNPLFKETLLKWLKIICFNCNKLLLNKNLDNIPNENKLSEYKKYIKPGIKCVNCGEIKHNIKKHKFSASRFIIEFYDKTGQKTGVEEELFNHEIFNILSKITDDIVYKLGKKPEAHPKKLIIYVLRVPPNTIRPDIKRTEGSRSNNSDITALIKNIIEINDALPSEIPEKKVLLQDFDIQQLYFNLDLTINEMIKGAPTSTNQIKLLTNMNKPPNSLANRLIKKTGRIRRNLMGKRVRMMGRSVVSGDNMLEIDQIGLPISMARSLQIPETVQPYNIKKLQKFFKNKRDIYPGCSMIYKKSVDKEYKVEIFDDDYQLQYGDIVYRDIIDGDVINFNRQPSLLYSNISCNRVVVLNEGLSLRMSVSSCVFYNADFDGDAMNIMIAQNIQARNEISTLSSPGNWFISYKDHAPMVGCFQDSLIGSAEFTQSFIKLDKWHAMNVMATVKELGVPFEFQKELYTSRELIKYLIPPINYPAKKSKLYMKQYEPFIDYKKEDIFVKIERGELVSGILDKATIGQGQMGSIFQIINGEYGHRKALDSIYNFHQLISRFFLYNGFTIGIEDINISEDKVKIIKESTADMIQKSYELIEKLNNQELIAPMGMDILDYFEAEQLNILSPGDDFADPILSDIDFTTNKMAKLVFSGSKGKPSNVIAINGAIGSQTINGARPLRNFSWGRTSPYFRRFDMSPESLGYVKNSFREGVESSTFPFISWEARHSLISNALSTSVSGHQNRISVKNLESIQIDNLNKALKQQNLIQPLYAESGIDIRKTEKVKFKTIMMSDKEMLEYKVDIKKLHSMYNNKNVQAILDAEFKQLLDDRQAFRDIFLKIEYDNPGRNLLSEDYQMPFNPFRIIEDVIFNHKEDIDAMSEKEKILDPIKAINDINELCDNLTYGFFNTYYKNNKGEVPEYIKVSAFMYKILIRTYLNISNLLSKKINNKLLRIIIDRINFQFKNSLMETGASVGVIAAQCLSEPLTQYVLDSKHRSGGTGGTKTNILDRLQEIAGAKPTDKMKNPSMTIIVKEEYENNRVKVQEIANYIEMMNFDRFVDETRIFFEGYKKIIHPDFKHEIKYIEQFEKLNIGIKVPSSLTNWCLHFTLNAEELLMNNMSLENIITKLRIDFPEVFFVYTPENVDDIIIRAYIMSSYFKNKEINLKNVKKLMEDLQNTIIRGVNNILSTEVITIVKSFIDKDGSIATKKVYGIQTNGTNLLEILDNPYIDPYKTQTDSIKEYEELFGIEAARNKIIVELTKTLSDISVEHCTLFSDEMCYSGNVTSIQKTGLQQREKSNIALHLSFQSPIQVLENAATNCLINHIGGISGPLILGRSANIGTCYNKVLINEQFVENYYKSNIKNIEDMI